ncbi:MAG TPA: DinB family protein [Flavisolibacter sp.]|nr:DinB family protein [Flavisolibacter sp.]
MHTVDLNKVPEFYHKYIQRIKEETVIDAINNLQQELNSFLNGIPEDKWLHKYAEGKWTIKEVVQHITDAERIFCYRALCFSRNEKASLPGFEENDYVAASNANNRSKESLLQELRTVQAATLTLFNSFTEGQLNAQGIANNNPIYVKGIGFIVAGHAKHHLEIIKERYL